MQWQVTGRIRNWGSCLWANGSGNQFPERRFVAEYKSQRSHIPTDLEVVLFADEIDQLRQRDMFPIPRLPLQRRVECFFDRQLALGWPGRSRLIRGKTGDSAAEHEDGDKTKQ
jgi:hypothetical protein